jgi:hypothetical protein
MITNNGSSSKKTAYNSASSYSINNNLSKGTLKLDIETPNKSQFEFGTILAKSNDKLSSQKTTATHKSNIK